MIRTIGLVHLLAWLCLAGTASADLLASRQPLFGATSDASGRASLLGPRKAPQVTTASLFVGARKGSLLAAPETRLDLPLTAAVRGGSAAARLRDLIARAEAGSAGYDAVQHGARIKPPKRPTQMTIADIYRWIDATPGQPHAIGRYQFIPSTLRRLVARLELDPGARFTPSVQDRLGDLLLADAGLARVQRQEITQDAFLLNLAKIWAGLPTASGRSYYHGLAGNKATMNYEAYARQVRAILEG